MNIIINRGPLKKGACNSKLAKFKHGGRLPKIVTNLISSGILVNSHFCSHTQRGVAVWKFGSVYVVLQLLKAQFSIMKFMIMWHDSIIVR